MLLHLKEIYWTRLTTSFSDLLWSGLVSFTTTSLESSSKNFVFNSRIQISSSEFLKNLDIPFLWKESGVRNNSYSVIRNRNWDWKSSVFLFLFKNLNSFGLYTEHSTSINTLHYWTLNITQCSTSLNTQHYSTPNIT